MRRTLRMVTQHRITLIRQAQRHAALFRLNRIRWHRRRHQRYIHRPTYLLSECYGRHCPNTRQPRSVARESIEHIILQTVRTHAPSSVCLVMAGPGDFLQEFCLIAQLATLIPQTLRHLHLIFLDQNIEAVHQRTTSRSLACQILHLRTTERLAKIYRWLDSYCQNNAFCIEYTENVASLYDSLSPASLVLICGFDLPEQNVQALLNITLSPGMCIVLDDKGLIHQKSRFTLESHAKEQNFLPVAIPSYLKGF